MSFERVSGPLHLQPWFGRTLGRPAIWSAVVYARLRYGVDLLQPSPLDAVRSSKVPVLLIHGEADRSIAPRHSQLIAAAAPDHVELWLVPHAGHTMRGPPRTKGLNHGCWAGSALTRIICNTMRSRSSPMRHQIEIKGNSRFQLISCGL